VANIMRLNLYRANMRNESQYRDFIALRNIIRTESAYNTLGAHATFYNDNRMTAADHEVAAGTSVAAVANSTAGLPTMHNNLSDPTNNFNTIVRCTGLAQALLQCGVTSIPGIQAYMSLNDSGTIENLQRTGNLLFSAIPCSDDNNPSLHNKAGMKEFLSTVGSPMKANNQYWWKHINHFMKNCNINIAAFIPRFLLTAPALAEHDLLVPSMHLRNGIGIGGSGEFFKLTLWRKYAIVFTKINQMPIVQAARVHGFMPIFLLRQCINQNVKNGVHAHLATTDLNGKSSIMLAGFYRDDTAPGEPPFSNLVFISVLGRDFGQEGRAHTSLLTHLESRHFVSERE